MRKKMYSQLAWLLALSIIFTNTSIAQASSYSAEDGTGNVSAMSVSSSTLDGDDMGTGDGDEPGTSDGDDIPTGEHILHAGRINGIIWSIDKEQVLTIAGTCENSKVASDTTLFDVAPWLEYSETYRKVVINAKNVTSTYSWLLCSTKVEEVDMSSFDTSCVEDMSYMFYGCTSLKTVDMSNCDTSKVKNMAGMFAGCQNMTSVNLVGLDTSSVEDMSSLFLSCKNLTALDISMLNTAKVRMMNTMFYGCESLAELKLGELNTSKVEVMAGMFGNCKSLSELDVKGINTSNVTNMYGMFLGCEKLNYLDVSGFDTAKVVDADSMFAGCTGIESITAFCNLQIDVELPLSPMYDEDCKMYTKYFPKKLEESITLCKTADLEGKLWVMDIEPQTYTGKAIMPKVNVYNGSELLKEKIDYTISYKNNKNVNDASDTATAPTVIVKGKGNYAGTEKVFFQICPVDLASEDVVAKNIYMMFGETNKKPVPVITYRGKKLKANTDYTVNYPESIKDKGKYIIGIKGVGNYTGEREISLIVSDGVLISKAKVASVSKQQWMGKAVEPKLKVSYKGVSLVENTDYTVSYKNNVDVGKATATITGIGKYTGEKDISFQIVGTSIAKAKISGIENRVYNGKSQEFDLKIELNGSALSKDDYEVTYSKNINAGTANVVITGKGKYSGTIKKKFKITPYNIAKDEKRMIKNLATSMDQYYVKGGVAPIVELTFDGMDMVLKKDYTVSYRSNKKVTDGNSAYVQVKGKGNFTGTYLIPMKIMQRSLADKDRPIVITLPDMVYSPKNGKYVSKPVLYDTNGKKLVAGTDYDKNLVYTLANGTVLDPKNDAPAVDTEIYVSIKGINNYKDTVIASYRITEASFNAAKIKVEPQIYTGKAVTLDKDDISVTLNGVELKYGQDYEIVEGTYSKNVSKGTASVMVKGLGNYGGTKTVKFKITGKEFVWFWNLF